MLTKKELAATLKAQKEQLDDIGGKLQDARDAWDTMQEHLVEAQELAEKLDIPGAALLLNAVNDAQDEDTIDAAQEVVGNLVYLFDGGTMGKLYPHCLGCINRRSGENCAAITDSGDFDFPCPHYGIMPAGCHCLRCKHYDTPFCTDDPGPCPDCHCCTDYEPAVEPAEDVCQRMLNL